MRAFKTVNDSYVEPISFIVPRRAEVFQDDIYPPAVGSKPGVSASEWFGGMDAMPPKISLESLYNGEEPVAVPSSYKAPTSAPAAAKPPSPVKEKLEQPVSPPVSSVVQKGPPPSMSDQKSSIANMASKFADKDEDTLEGEPEEPSDDFDVAPRARESPKTMVNTEMPRTSGAAEPTPIAGTMRSPGADDTTVHPSAAGTDVSYP